MFSLAKKGTLHVPTYERPATEYHTKDALDQYKSTDVEEINASKCRVSPFLLIFLLILLLSSLVVNIFLASRPSPVGSACDRMRRSNRVCLKCKYFQDGSNFLWAKSGVNISEVLVNREKEECCFDYTESLHQFYQTSFLRYLSTGASQTEDKPRPRPMAHLTLNATASKRLPARLRWNVKRDGAKTAFMKHVKYTDDKIVVPEAGTYYVYSFITFRSREIHGQNDHFLNHYLYRFNENHGAYGAQMLFMDKQTRQHGDLEYQTSYLAGILNLEKNDRLFTVVSDVSAVYGSSLSNYFGLFKL